MRERNVLEYLRDNPRFFRKHQAEVTRMLRLAERDVIDLTGRQIVALRDENSLVRRQLRSWYQNAADNEAIMLFLHRLAVNFASTPLKPGSVARVLAREMKRALNIELCKLCDLKLKPDTLSELDRKKLEGCDGALRVAAPLPSLAKLSANGDWGAYLYVPVWGKRGKMRAVIVTATSVAREFPRDAYADYAISMAEIVAAALLREG